MDKREIIDEFLSTRTFHIRPKQLIAARIQISQLVTKVANLATMAERERMCRTVNQALQSNK